MPNNSPVELTPNVIIGYDHHSGNQIPENYPIGGCATIGGYINSESDSSESLKDSSDSSTELNSAMDTSPDDMPYDVQDCTKQEFDAELDAIMRQIQDRQFVECDDFEDEIINDGPTIGMEEVCTEQGFVECDDFEDEPADDDSKVYDESIVEKFSYNTQMLFREFYKIQTILPQLSALESYDLADAFKSAESIKEWFDSLLNEYDSQRFSKYAEQYAYGIIRHHLQGYKADDVVYQTSKRYWLREPGVYRKRDGGMKIIINRKDY
jgi:hypothetical protein